jgi:aspartate-semialdehyde dehydrogenase
VKQKLHVAVVGATGAVGDQFLKVAALNAVQIAEELIK